MKTSGLFPSPRNRCGSERIRPFQPPAVLKADACSEPDPEQESRLFLAAMADVTPFSRSNRREKTAPDTKPKETSDHPEAETFRKLNELVETGQGFVVSLTPEYREGLGYRVHPIMARRLHHGDFSIQDHIDLHGYGVADARAALDAFLTYAIATRKRAVLVVHGRGLSSPKGPVLKEKVHAWLTTGYWRKWVLAFTSARRHDGGAGATYVLLRERPASRKCRSRIPRVEG
ncbi:MAG: Smr/MutS family protein [Thermodesulfobacteriota bacterium]